MTLIVGLGNPTKRYERTRHNAGFLAVDRLIERLKPVDISKSAFKGATLKSGDLALLKPTTYMNLCGESVCAVKNFYKPETIIVAHDDIDLPFGALRFKFGGASGGHNGLKSIDALCGAEYVRVRMGVGRPSGDQNVVDYLLSVWSADEAALLDKWTNQAADAILDLVCSPLERVQSTRTQSCAQ
ncbi:MAG: aminoacyl-tRNA hydrolase [Helicobacteraceae bacterium]|jgi:PTH1 family peptidyl-tRNA hydrolase|nr:aminoacyl-tRNA hydrolase [Helicobacteraceae bacterium]